MYLLMSGLNVLMAMPTSKEKLRLMRNGDVRRTVSEGGNDPKICVSPQRCRYDSFFFATICY